MAIIQVGDTFYTLTDHAVAQMMMRGISEEEVIEVIETGELDYTERGDIIYRKDIGKRRIAVIVIEGTERISTAFIVTKD